MKILLNIYSIMNVLNASVKNWVNQQSIYHTFNLHNNVYTNTGESGLTVKFPDSYLNNHHTTKAIK